MTPTRPMAIRPRRGGVHHGPGAQFHGEAAPPPGPLKLAPPAAAKATRTMKGR